jgi:Tfp pilus assembly ATPase PilU
MYDFQAEDLITRSRDVQLLRLSKEMQEFLRSGDIHKQATELSNLEKVSDHSQKTHVYQIEEKQKLLSKLGAKKNAKISENLQLVQKLSTLDGDIEERNKIQQVKCISLID